MWAALKACQSTRSFMVLLLYTTSFSRVMSHHADSKPKSVRTSISMEKQLFAREKSGNPPQHQTEGAAATTKKHIVSMNERRMQCVEIVGSPVVGFSVVGFWFVGLAVVGRPVGCFVGRFVVSLVGRFVSLVGCFVGRFVLRVLGILVGLVVVGRPVGWRVVGTSVVGVCVVGLAVVGRPVGRSVVTTRRRIPMAIAIAAKTAAAATDAARMRLRYRAQPGSPPSGTTRAATYTEPPLRIRVTSAGCTSVASRAAAAADESERATCPRCLPSDLTTSIRNTEQ